MLIEVEATIIYVARCVPLLAGGLLVVNNIGNTGLVVKPRLCGLLCVWDTTGAEVAREIFKMRPFDAPLLFSWGIDLIFRAPFEDALLVA